MTDNAIFFRLKDVTEQSERNPWRSLGKRWRRKKTLPERQYHKYCPLCFICARLRLAREEGLGPISIKHGPLTILIYDTDWYFHLFRLKDVTEQSERNPWRCLGEKWRWYKKLCLKGNTISFAFLSFSSKNRRLSLNSSILCVFISARLTARTKEEGLGRSVLNKPQSWQRRIQ